MRLKGSGTISSPSGGNVLNYIFSVWIKALRASMLASNSAPKSLPCQLSYPSIFYPNPFPFSVLQITAVGLLLWDLAFFKESTIYPTEWPSIVTTLNPNDLKRSAYTLKSFLYIVKPDWPILFTSTNTVKLFNL